MKPITEITLAQGNGGQGMQQLIDSLFLQAFSNPYLNEKKIRLEYRWRNYRPPVIVWHSAPTAM